MKSKQKTNENSVIKEINIDDIDEIINEIDMEKEEMMKNEGEFEVILKKYEGFDGLLNNFEKAKGNLKSIFDHLKEIY